MNFVNLSADASTRRQELATLDRALKRTMLASQRGRPLYSGKTRGASPQAVLDEVTGIVRAMWQRGDRPAQEAVLQFLSVNLEPRDLRRIVTGQTGLSWELFIEKNRPR